MKSEPETVLVLDLVAIAIDYNIPRGISRPIIERAVAEMRCEVERHGKRIRRTPNIMGDWGGHTAGVVLK